MASNNYTSANITPSADTFREWVDLTNRITYDMEKIVITTAANTQGARTSGNASVNGFFSANTLIVDAFLRGGDSNSTVYGTASASANLVVISNTVFAGNSSVSGVIFAQSNIIHTGALLDVSSNVNINSTSTTFTSNAATNIFNTKIDANANVDIDNALTTIDSTNTLIGSGELNITSNVNFDAATFDINDGVFNANTTAINIDPSALTFTSNAGTNVFNTPIDANANVDVDNALTTIDSSNTTIAAGELNITSNVNIDAASIDINDGVLKANTTGVEIDATALTFTSNATTNIFNTKIDANANVDIDNALTDITSANLAITGTETNISSNLTSTALATFTGANVYSTAANNALMSNVNIGQSATDFLRSDATVVFNETLNVVKGVDFDSTLNVDGATTLNGAVTLGNATGDDLTFKGYGATGITPKANGTLSLGTSALRWDANLDDVSIDDLVVINNTAVGNNLSVTGFANVTGTFAVNTALSITYPDANTRVVIIGANTAANTASNDRLLIKSQVGNTTFGLMALQGNNVPLGNNTNRWVGSFATANTSGAFTSTGDITGGGNFNLTSEANVGTLAVVGESSHAGLASFSQGITVVGTSTLAIVEATGLASLDGGINVVSGADANVQAFTVAGTTGNIATSGTLAVAGNTTITSDQEAFVNSTASIAALKVSGGILALKDIKTAANGNFGYVNITTNLDVAGAANIDGNLVVDGTTILGDAIGDTITLNGQVFGNTTAGGIIPSGNGAALGTSDKRWAGQFVSINTSGDVTASSDVDVTGQANTGTLIVRSTSTLLGAVNFGNSTINANLSANSTQSLFAADKVVVTDFTASGSVSLPSNTVLNLATANTADLSVTNSAVFSTGANTTISFGDGNGRATLTFANAVFDSHFGPANTNIHDIGSAAVSWRTGYFDTSVVVGDTAITSSSITANNIYATDDIVANYSSDQHLKDNVLVIDSALNKLDNIGGYSFRWNHKIGDHREGTDDYGVLAQEIEEILPNAVSMNSRGFKTVNYNAVIPLLVQAVKELSAKVDYYMQADIEGDQE